MGAINLAVARLVATIRMLIDTGGWGGHGIRSVEHWVQWKAGLKASRAKDLVRIARRTEELPACWALFESGRLTEERWCASRDVCPQRGTPRSRAGRRGCWWRSSAGPGVLPGGPGPDPDARPP